MPWCQAAGKRSRLVEMYKICMSIILLTGVQGAARRYLCICTACVLVLSGLYIVHHITTARCARVVHLFVSFQIHWWAGENKFDLINKSRPW